MPQAASWSGSPATKGSTEAVRMAFLTFSLIGLQFTWGIEMTYCTPYLLQLGLTKSRTSLVWIAGPLSGLIMQPLVGVIADNSKSKWGRRRPFMIGGSVIVVVGLFALGWTNEIVGLFTQEPDKKSFWTIVLAILSIYAVDFAINAVQASSRSLIVDTLPIEKQQTGSAWASRMVAVGHLVGYGVGTLDLIKIFGTTFGDSQFKQLIWIAALALIFSVGLTSWTVTERILLSAKEGSESGPFQMVTKIWRTALDLPPRIQAICWIQFWAWIGWFPFLFYSPTWVGETYFRYSAPPDIDKSPDKLGELGRIGSMSLVIFSIVTLGASIFLPWCISKPEDEKQPFTPRPPPVIASLITKIHENKPDLLTAWLGSHLIFSAAMLLAPLVRSLQFATALVSICGIPWALACWAPFSFIGVEINRLTAPTTMHANGNTYQALPGQQRQRRDSLAISERSSAPLLLHLNLDHDSDDPEAPNGSTGEMAGIYLGILNLFITLPQFVGTFISMVVFAILEPGKSKELAGDKGPDVTHPEPVVNAIGVCLFIGALSSLGAAYATHCFKHVR